MKADLQQPVGRVQAAGGRARDGQRARTLPQRNVGILPAALGAGKPAQVQLVVFLIPEFATALAAKISWNGPPPTTSLQHGDGLAKLVRFYQHIRITHRAQTHICVDLMRERQSSQGQCFYPCLVERSQSRGGALNQHLIAGPMVTVNPF